MEIPEWNPYLGGGFPLSPSSKYTYFYGIDRTTFAVLMAILTLICLIVEGFDKLSSVFIFSFYTISLLTYSPVPMSICLLSVGVVNNSKVARIISSMITPSLSLLYELSIRNPSVIAILSALVGLIDVILANAYTPHMLAIIDNPPTFMEILVNTVVYGLIIIPTIIILYVASKLTTNINTKRILIAYAILFLVMFVEFSYMSILLASAPIITICVLKVLRKIKFNSGKPARFIYFLSLVALEILFISTISALSSPHAILSEVKTIGKGVPLVVTCNTYFDMVVKEIFHGKILANPPVVAYTPVGRSIAAFLKSFRATSTTLIGIYPAASTVERFKFIVPMYVSPKLYTLKSVTLYQTCEIVSKVRHNEKLVYYPRIITPREIVCKGLTFQQYSIWWTNCKCWNYMIVGNGKVYYSRPSALVTVLVQPLLLLGTILRRKK